MRHAAKPSVGPTSNSLYGSYSKPVGAGDVIQRMWRVRVLLATEAVGDTE